MGPNQAREEGILERAVRALDARKFVARHRGYKESVSAHSFEWLLPCPMKLSNGEVCGSDRLRWNSAKGTWICWSCQSTGDTFRLIMAFEGVDEEGAADFLLESYVGGDARIDQLSGLKQEAKRPVVRPLAAIPWPDGVDILVPGAAPHAAAWAYLQGRGITAEDVSTYRLGIGRSGRLDGYIVFPCFMDGNLVYYQGRATWDPPPWPPAERKQWVEATHYRKTLNPIIRSEVDTTASEVLFNYDRARHEPHVVLVEGPVDAVKVGPHAVAYLGKGGREVSEAKIERLLRMKATRITIYLDHGTDPEANAIAARLATYVEVYRATPPPGKDPGASTRWENGVQVNMATRVTGSKMLRSNLR